MFRLLPACLFSPSSVLKASFAFVSVFPVRGVCQVSGDPWVSLHS